MYKLFIMHF